MQLLSSQTFGTYKCKTSHKAAWIGLKLLHSYGKPPRETAALNLSSKTTSHPSDALDATHTSTKQE
jgi:hypothetical protein